MKTKIIFIYLILFLIVCSSLIFAQSPYHRDYSNHTFSINDYLVSVYEQKLSSDFIRLDSLISSSVQGTSSKILFQYNENNKITESLILDNFGSGWENSIKDKYFYNTHNNLITEINLGWYINEWDSLSRINYSYVNGMLSQSVFQNYINNYWENLSRNNYEYDANQNISIALTEDWIKNTWQNRSLVTNYYALQNKRDSILFQTFVNNDWQNDKKTIFYYSENQIDLDSIVASSWNGLSWINLFKREIVNDANHNQIEQIDREWNAGSWQNSIRRFYTYNEFNYIQFAFCEIWYNNQWMRGDSDILFQYPNDFIIAIITNNISAYYSNIVSVDENENLVVSDFSLSQNYPNPFNPSTTINFTIPTPPHPSPYQGEGAREGLVLLRVYDILGREVAMLINKQLQPGEHEVEFNAVGLSSGIYYYRLQAGNYSETKKMILLR